MHRTSGRWQLGLTLALITSLMWGVLPIALKGVLLALDPYTTSFFRFFLAALLLTPFLIRGGKSGSYKELRKSKIIVSVAACGVCLAGNYATYIVGLHQTTAEAAQIVIQLAPLLLLLSGVALFGEKLTPGQWTGVPLFLCGLLLFFNQRLEELFLQGSAYGLGVWLVMAAAILWVGYAILQKILLQYLRASQIMLFVYWLGAFLFLPFSDFSRMPALSLEQWLLLIFCGLNTLIAYSCFAQSLEHWDASRISATVTIAPLLTILFAHLFFGSTIQLEPLNPISLSGACLVVAGCMLTALVRNKPSSDVAQSSKA